MCKLLIFGGTTEGRLLTEFCDRNKISAMVSVVSEYGKELLKESDYIKVNAAPMDAEEMKEFFINYDIGLVVDATHPYAVSATGNIKKACGALGIRRVRCLRETGEVMGSKTEADHGIVCVPSVSTAASFLKNRAGNVLVTTGSKELAEFTRIPGFKERGYVRVLPSVEAVKKCAELGVEKSHLICMQGPFSEEMNIALLHQTRAEYLVTKETGDAGGFSEKLTAAAKCGVLVIVVKHMPEQDGLNPDAVCLAMKEFSKECGRTGKTDRTDRDEKKETLTVSLVGIGPGDIGQMTEAARTAVSESQVLFGAPRVLEAVNSALCGKETICIPKYLAADVAEWLEAGEHNCIKKAAVLFSGDTGFYSGAKKMGDMLKEKKIAFCLLPGISSVAYLAARLGTSWEDAGLYTAHGRDFSPAAALTGGEKKMFLLLGGADSVGRLCRTLCECGFESVRVSVGENLSYEKERIVTGTAAELKGMEFGPLCLALIEKEDEK